MREHIVEREGGEVRARSLARLGEVVRGLPDGPVRGIFEALNVATRARAGLEVPELMSMELSRRMGALELVAANQPATPALAEAARSVLWQTSTFATLSDRHLAMWAELSLDEGEGAAARAVAAARLHETNSADRIRIYGRLLAAGVPRTTAGVLGLCEALDHEVEVDAVLSSWLSRTRVDACEALFMQLRSPGARLETVAAQAALGWRPAQWEPWLVVADVALEWAKRGEGPAEMGPPRLAVNLARKAQLVRLSGGEPSASRRLWERAIEEAGREAQPAMAARIHRAMLFAAAGDFEAWMMVVRSIGADRAYLRDAESWLSVRCEVVRSMVGAVAGGGAAEVDRAHQELRELGQRLPNRWYELFYAAVVARELARVGRSIEVVMAQLEAWMRDGLPRPVVPVSTEELVGPLLTVDAERVWRLGEGLARSAPQHATWLSAVAIS